MKKNLFLSLLLVTSSFTSNEMMAAVTPIEGAVTPEISTADSPKWYLLMSSHLTDATRQNRFLKLDGSTLCTEQFSSGIPDDQVTEAFIWRLESANDGTATHTYLVNSNGQRVFVPASATAEDGSVHINTPLEMNETGSVWNLATSQSTGLNADCAEGQYVLQFVNYSGERAFLNAMDGGTKFGITIYAAGVHQASGWFFYPTEYTPTATRTVSVASADTDKGSVAIEGETGSSIETAIDQTVTIKATAQDGYMFYRWIEKETSDVVSYRHTYNYEGEESINLVAEFVEKDYPIMTRFYEIGLNQQNRYLGAASYIVGNENYELFTCNSEEELPFTEYREIHTPQIEGAVIDKTSTPIELTEGIESFTLKLKQYDNNITYNNGTDIECAPELIWTRQALYIDWNNDMTFDGENELYEPLGDSSENNNFGDPNGSIAEGWQRTIAIPEGTADGTYRMRVVYMAPNPYSADWNTKVFTDFFNELRNGVAYDFSIHISPASGIEAVTAKAAYYDRQAQALVAPHMDKVVIYNLSGQIVWQAENTTEVSVTALSQGVYIANIDGIMVKFIK